VVRHRCLSLLYSNEERSIKQVTQLVHIARRPLERFFNAWELAMDHLIVTPASYCSYADEGKL
jgi:hypothetical protein